MIPSFKGIIDASKQDQNQEDDEVMEPMVIS